MHVERGHGMAGGTSPNTGKKATKYRCLHPVTGEAVFKNVFKREGMKEPVALWYEHAGTWYLNTVVDGADLPDWQKNYTHGKAEIVE